MLLVHGFPGTPAELRPLGEALAALGYHVRAPLLPGFGRDIVRLGEVAYPAWVQAVRDAWRTLCSESDEAVLLGYSMGAAVALAVAAEISAEAADDSLPDHLVLIAPFWQLGDWRASLLPLVKLVKPRLKPFENADFSDPAVRDQFTRILPDADLDDPAVQQRLRDEIVLPTSAIDELRKLGKHAAKAAPDVTVPTLVVQGRGDTTVAARDTRTLATKLGGRLTLAEVEAPHELIYPGVDGFSDLTAILEGYLSAK